MNVRKFSRDLSRSSRSKIYPGKNVYLPNESFDPEAGINADSTKGYNGATRASWLLNWILLFVKAYIVAISNSKSVTASLADSAGAWHYFALKIY